MTTRRVLPLGVLVALLVLAALVVLGAAPAQDVAPPGQAPAKLPAPRASVAPDSCATAGCHTDVKEYAWVHGPVGANACAACHTPVDETQHTFALTREREQLCTFCHDIKLDEPIVHAPLLTGDCTGCHDPHGGAAQSLLRAGRPADSCLTCHDDVTARGTNVHGPVAAGACTACHAPHASPYPGLLAASGVEICLRCHVSSQMQLDKLRVVHPPVADDCQICHDPHASDHPMMLADRPQTVCLSCHEAIRHTVETARTQHAAVTTDRECLNCHVAHGSDHAGLLQEQMMTLCFECHDREIEMPDGTTLGNIKQVIQAGRSLHGPVAQSDCSACHQIHGGDLFRLLTKEYPPEFYAPFKEESYGLCFSCHDAQLVRDARTTTLTDFRNGDVNLHYLHVNRDKKGRTCRACHETHASNQANHVREAVPFGRGGWMLPIKFEKLDTGGSCMPGCHKPYRYDRVEPVEYEPAGDAFWPAEGAGPGTGDAPRAPGGGTP